MDRTQVSEVTFELFNTRLPFANSTFLSGAYIELTISQLYSDRKLKLQCFSPEAQAKITQLNHPSFFFSLSFHISLYQIQTTQTKKNKEELYLYQMTVFFPLLSLKDQITLITRSSESPPSIQQKLIIPLTGIFKNSPKHGRVANTIFCG